MTSSRRPGLAFLTSSPTAFLALGCGAGLVPLAPGTAGSLLAIPVVGILQGLPLNWQLGICAAMCVLGIWLCGRTGRALGESDHPAIVWDEICGQTIVLLLVPPGPGWLLAGFIAFRFFDIAKPWPIRSIDRRWRNGFGAMADDLLAAAYAAATIALLSLVAPLIAGR